MTQNYSQLLERLLSLPQETEYVEFKRSFSEPEREGKDISALANSAAYHGTQAAYKIWGIEDSTHEVLGTSFSHRKKKVGNQPLEVWLRQHLTENANFEFHEELFHEQPVVVLKIWPALHYPVKYDSVPYIRTDSSTQTLKPGSTREIELWKRIQQENFESQVSISNLGIEEALAMLSYPVYFSLLDIPQPQTPKEILHYFAEEGLLLEQDDGLVSITNLGALLFANDLSQFPNVWRKSIRVIVYDGTGKAANRREREFSGGYAIELDNAYEFIDASLPLLETISGTKRTAIPSYPGISIRETLVNALIHQDLLVSGTGPMVEIFDNRLEITNPGIPLVNVARIVNDPPRSRNETLSALIRRFRFCEEAGSGWDKVMEGCEQLHLPAPKIDTSTGSSTKVSLFSAKPFRELTPKERLDACYWHACVCYENNSFMTNASLRERLGLGPSNAAQVSRLIKAATEEGLIKAVDQNTSPRYMRYMPGWA